MSLVADYSSDPGTESEQEESSISEQRQNKQESCTPEKKTSLFSTLPPPKNRVVNIATTNVGTISSSKNKKRAEGPVKILVDLPKPSEKDNLDSDSDDEEREAKRLKFGTSGKGPGSGLFSILPAPTRTIASKDIKTDKNDNESKGSNGKTVKTTSFVPHTVKKQKSATVAKPTKALTEDNKSQVNKESISDNQDDETSQSQKDEEISFFPLGDNSYMYTTASTSYGAGVSYASGVNDSSWHLQQQQEESEIALNEEIIAKLGGRRNKKEREAGAIQVKDIDARDQLGDDAWRSQMAQLTKPGQVSSGAYSHLKPSKGQKRKHNLAYLVHQASVMENDLKEQYANNRKTKRETQAKYGKYIISEYACDLAFAFYY
ncbi:7376_t:CDS:2 [Ambispora leptoticha]|uniref:7376_t:CDS:1 n=1 Tax=Ambispora leptoticha TaxID=144679 RepID=A0A9N8Z1U1_9GLOM|nr:7376_t:CDS:2 [Ambispora leptoticha]